MRISDWSSDVCAADLERVAPRDGGDPAFGPVQPRPPDLGETRTRRYREAVRAALIFPLPFGRGRGPLSAAEGEGERAMPRARLALRSEERRVGKECVVSVDLGGQRLIQKKKRNTTKNCVNKGEKNMYWN